MRRTLLLVTAMAAIAAPAAADVISLTPSRDNTLYEENEVSNGMGSTLFSGNTASSLHRRALIEFDLSGIPAGAIIDSVSLKLQVTRTRAGAVSHALHRMLGDWGEGPSNAGTPGGGGVSAEPGDATWNQPFYGTPGNWTTPGGDFAAAASATTIIGGLGSHTFASTAQLIADVQAWLADPASNFGWLVHGDESTAMTAKRFASREHTNAGYRPTLIINYTIPAPGSASLIGLVGLAALRRRRG